MQLHVRRPSQGLDSIALEWNERARARGLLETLQGPTKNALRGFDPKMRSKELDIQRRLNAAAEREDRAQEPGSTSKRASRIEIEALKAELRLARNKIRSRESRHTALTRPETLSLARIKRELLDSNTALLEYSLGTDGSYVWLVTDSSLFAYELPNQVEIEKVALKVYGLLSDGVRSTLGERTDAQYLEAAGKLSEMILGPVAEKITGKRLVIVADGALHYIPFGALPQPKGKRSKDARIATHPLAVTNEIVSLPSASTLAVLRNEAGTRKQGGNGVAIIADPVFSDTDDRFVTAKRALPRSSELTKPDLTRALLERAFNFSDRGGEKFSIPRLPFTRREAESIFVSAGQASIKFLDFDASRQKILTSDLSEHRILHFATHGVLHGEHPELSGIVLSLVNEKGEPVNGFLRLNEISNLNLNADLVVLSACQTALGKEIRGEGLVGLTRGFMYAGSPRVVASLWKVDDVATAELMKIFYQKMLKEKMRPAAALRMAKIEMMKQKRWNSPYYWAAFELHGEWR